MARIHFLNVLEGDCNIIQHDSGRLTVMDVSNAYNDYDTPEETAKKNSIERRIMLNRTNVPSDKKDYGQKKYPDNPIEYLKNRIKTSDIFRFIVTHPDMDHLDGIKDLYEEFNIINTWDTDNNKVLDLNNFGAGYNKEDWKFYTSLRAGNVADTKRLTYFAGNSNSYYNDDNIKILCPTADLVRNANVTKDYNDSSYVILFTPPKKNGQRWKFLFAGDSHDDSWEYILENHKTEVSDIDVLFAPHHGRDSDRDYTFLKTLKPKVTLFGNAKSGHLAYSCYPETRITNNQAGYVVIDISEEKIVFYVKNYDFARDYKAKRGWGEPVLNRGLNAYGLFQRNA